MLSRLLELNDEARGILSGFPAYVELDRDEYYVFSDIHGFLKAAELVARLVESGRRVIVLGDYTSRSKACARGEEDSVRVLAILYEALVENPDRLMLLRGNHEDQSVHYLPVSLLLRDVSRYVDEAEIPAVEEELLRTMREMPIVAKIGTRILVHGGLPVEEPLELESLRKPADICAEHYEYVRNAPSADGRAKPRMGIAFNCLGEHRVSSLFGSEQISEAREKYGINEVIVGHIHPSSGLRRFRRIPVYAVCSSYASCSVRRPKYALVGEKILGEPIRYGATLPRDPP